MSTMIPRTRTNRRRHSMRFSRRFPRRCTLKSNPRSIRPRSVPACAIFAVEVTQPQSTNPLPTESTACDHQKRPNLLQEGGCFAGQGGGAGLRRTENRGGGAVRCLMISGRIEARGS